MSIAIKGEQKSNIFQRLSVAYVALLLTVYLLALPLGGYSGIVGLKYTLFLAISGGYVALTVLIWLELQLVGKGQGNLIEAAKATSFTGKLLFGYMVFTLISTAFSKYPNTFLGADRFEGALTICIYVLSCLLLSHFFVPKRWMLYLFAATVSVLCLFCLPQLTGFNPLGLYPNGHNYYGSGIYYFGEYLGTVGNVALLAAILSIAVGVLAMSLITLKFRRKWLLSIPLLITVFTLLEINVDAGLVALLCGLIIMLPVAINSRKRLTDTFLTYAVILIAFAISYLMVFFDGGVKFTFSSTFAVFLGGAVLLLVAGWLSQRLPEGLEYRRYAVVMMVLILLGALVFLWFYKGTSGLLFEASEVLHGRWDDDFGTKRVYIWRNVLGELGGNFLFGTGADTLGYWDIEPFTRYNETLDVWLTSGIDAAHNEYLHILACQGVFALLSYLAALIFAAISWFKQPQNSLSAIAGAGVLFYCVQAFFGISMCISAPFFWLCLAIFISSQKNNNLEERK